MTARGIRPITPLSGGIPDQLLSRAVRQLEDRIPEMIRHTHDVVESVTQVIAKTADSTFNSTTPLDVPRGATGTPLMSFAVFPGRSYHFRFVSLVRSDTAGTGPAMSVTIPSATRFGARGLFASIAADGTDAVYEGAITASDDAVIASAVAAADTDYVFTIEGILIPTAAGSIVLRARNETGAAVITVRQGSCGFLTVTG